MPGVITSIQNDCERINLFLSRIFSSSQRSQGPMREPLHLALVPDTLRHIAALNRVLLRPRSALLAIGHASAGRRSVCRLAGSQATHSSLIDDLIILLFVLTAYMAQAEVCEPGASCTSLSSWREAIRHIVFQAAIAFPKPTVLFVSDTLVPSPACLDDVSHLVDTGSVPGTSCQSLHPLVFSIEEKIYRPVQWGSVEQCDQQIHLVSQKFRRD